MRLWGLPSPLLPQDIEFASSNPPTHEGNAIAFSRSLRALRSKQHVKNQSNLNKAIGIKICKREIVFMLGISILFERKNQFWYLLSSALELFL